MLVVNELVSADIYCDDYEAFAIEEMFHQVAEGPATIDIYKEMSAPDTIRNRVTIRRMKANHFYRILDSVREHIYE